MTHVHKTSLEKTAFCLTDVQRQCWHRLHLMKVLLWISIVAVLRFVYRRLRWGIPHSMKLLTCLPFPPSTLRFLFLAAHMTFNISPFADEACRACHSALHRLKGFRCATCITSLCWSLCVERLTLAVRHAYNRILRKADQRSIMTSSIDTSAIIWQPYMVVKTTINRSRITNGPV